LSFIFPSATSMAIMIVACGNPTAGQQHTGLSEAVVIALQTGQHQVGFFFLDRGRESLCRAQRIELREIVVHNVNAAICAFG